MSKVNELRHKIVLLINITYYAKIGDKVYDYHKPERIGEIIEKKPTIYSDFRIRWDDGKEENQSIRYGGTPMISCNFCLLINKDEIETIWKEIQNIEAAINRINFKQFVSDIKNSLSDSELKTKYKLNDDEYESIIDSPHIKFVFS